MLSFNDSTIASVNLPLSANHIKVKNRYYEVFFILSLTLFYLYLLIQIYKLNNNKNTIISRDRLISKIYSLTTNISYIHMGLIPCYYFLPKRLYYYQVIFIVCQVIIILYIHFNYEGYGNVFTNENNVLCLYKRLLNQIKEKNCYQSNDLLNNNKEVQQTYTNLQFHKILLYSFISLFSSIIVAVYNQKFKIIKNDRWIKTSIINSAKQNSQKKSDQKRDFNNRKIISITNQKNTLMKKNKFKNSINLYSKEDIIHM